MKIKFPQMPNPMLIADNGFVSQWCCKCGNRHIWHFKIHKGDKLTGMFIEATCFQDDKGTELRKFYQNSLPKEGKITRNQ